MKPLKSVTGAIAALPMLAICTGCYTSHKIESTHEVKPIHITLDVNVKVDKALDDFFDDPGKKNAVPQTAAAKEPAPTAQTAQKVNDPIPGEATPAPKAQSTGGTAAEIKERIKQRQPQINELKAKGIVGESNKGFLEFMGESKEGAELVNDENSDRSKVYVAIAKKNSSTPELIQKRRAAKLAERAAKGDWIQDESGKWTQKQ